MIGSHILQQRGHALNPSKFFLEKKSSCPTSHTSMQPVCVLHHTDRRRKMKITFTGFPLLFQMFFPDFCRMMFPFSRLFLANYQQIGAIPHNEIPRKLLLILQNFTKTYKGKIRASCQKAVVFGKFNEKKKRQRESWPNTQVFTTTGKYAPKSLFQTIFHLSSWLFET